MIYCTVKSFQCIWYPNLDEKRDIRSNIALSLRAKPMGTPEGKGLYLTMYPKLSLIRSVYLSKDNFGNNSLVNSIENKSVNSLGSVEEKFVYTIFL